MEVNCEGCAGCCIDWRAIAPAGLDDHERRGRFRPLDDVYNLVPLTRKDVQAFLDAGLADAMTPRLWRAEEGTVVEIDGVELAAIDGKPAFFVGLRKPPKPVAPFDREDAAWLPTCAFLDPETLQCRIHDTDVYPEECADYPGHNLALGVEAECERVESAFGGDRLLDDEPPAEQSGLLLGPQAIGEKVFVHPEPDELSGVIERVVEGTLTADDRATFVAAAAAGSPGTTETNEEFYTEAYEQARIADSWVGRASEKWQSLAERDAGDPGLAGPIEEGLGAPETPGW